MKLLIDTNVILDVLMRREPFFFDSYRLIKTEKDTSELCFTASAATDIYYILRKAKGAEEAKKALAVLIQLINCADVQRSDVLNALSSEMIGFEDAVVDAVASRVKADYIITRNAKDFRSSRIMAVTPAEFLQSAVS